MFPVSRILLICLCVLLAGCASLGGSAGKQQSQQNYWASQQPYEWPPYQQSDAGDLDLGPAPRALMAEADEHYEIGAYGPAEAALERALRLAPRSPVVWYRLAGLRASMGDAAGANRLAEKARSLAGPQTGMRVQQWLDWLSDWLLTQLR